MTDSELLVLIEAGILERPEFVYVGPPLPAPEHEWVTDELGAA